jgi:hypothetical protein
MFSENQPAPKKRFGERITLTTSVQEFGLPFSTSAPSSPSVMPFEFDEPFTSGTPPDPAANEQVLPILKRLNRHNLLGVRSGSLNDISARVSSPLRTSFPHRSSFLEKAMQEESDSERERDKLERRRWTRGHRNGSSPSSSSDLTTPPIPMDSDAAGPSSSIITARPLGAAHLRSSSSSMSLSDGERGPARRIPQSVKPPRLLSLLSESNPAENELKSEAQFQRMLASYNGSRIGKSKASRPLSERGRYPEEADNDDGEREESPNSDDDDLTNTTATTPFHHPPHPAPINLNLLEDAPMLESFRNSPS